MMDQMRLINSSEQNSHRDDIRTKMIYMQFLMYESAREAITKLIEFEPSQAESLINILCSELTLFPFLKKRFEGNFKGRRLDLRIEEYARVMEELAFKIEESRLSPNWRAARATFPELTNRYADMCQALSLRCRFQKHN